MKLFTRLLLFAIFSAALPARAQINVTDAVIAADMVTRLVGTGITYSNPKLTCDTFARGNFDVISSNLGLTGGVVLTSGRASTSGFNIGVNGDQSLFAATSGPNCFTSADTGDIDLSGLAGVTTHDACVLEFDFIPDGDSLVFDYVFGSEEYDAFSCSSFNDVFAFFLSGPGIVGTQNLAVIPGTTIPVSVNSTTNPAITMPFSTAACTAMGPGSPFTTYYFDNSVGTTVTYYGFTTGLSARAEVIPCTTYHIKLAIADGSDCTLDSGVFLQENSFRSTNIQLGVASSLGAGYNYLVEGCSRAVVEVKRPKIKTVNETFFLGYSNSATRNSDYFSVPDSVVILAGDSTVLFNIDPVYDGIDEGLEVIQVNILNSCSGAVIDSVTFDVYDYLPHTLYSDDTGVCGSGEVSLRVGDSASFTWFWRATPADPTIANPAAMVTTANPTTTTEYIVSATLTTAFGTCYTDTTSFVATVEPNPIVDIYPEDTTVCLSRPMPIPVFVSPESFSAYSYSWTPADLLDDPTKKEPLFFSDGFGDYQYFLTVTTPLGCAGTDSTLIRTRTALQLVNVSPDTTIPFGASIRLNADSALYYTWTPPYTVIKDNNTGYPLVMPTEPTVYTVYGINQYGCRDTAEVFVDIDYSMNDVIPNAFTPNGDGQNDVFRPSNLKYQKVAEFKVFNRWGREVYSSQSAAGGWDGTFNGAPQDMGTYHYLIRIIRPDGSVRNYQGDVTLIR